MSENRIIKFKAKDLYSDEWVEGDYHRRNRGEEKHFIITTVIDADGEEGYVMRRVKPLTVCQYVGVTDSKGVAVYEQDVCRLEATAIMGIVEYIDGGFVFKSYGGLRFGWDYCVKNGLTVIGSRVEDY